jgi:hypothetical protein
VVPTNDINNGVTHFLGEGLARLGGCAARGSPDH